MTTGWLDIPYALRHDSGMNTVFCSVISLICTAPVRVLAVIVALCPLSACVLLNDTVRLDDSKVLAPRGERALVIYGVAVEGAWRYPEFGVSLDEFSIERHAITGDCWSFNRIQASVPKDSTTVQYHAFDVAPGYYIYSGFNAEGLRGPNTFLVPESEVVYLGDFVYTTDDRVVLRRDISAALPALAKSYPKLTGKIVLAEIVSAAPTMFLCTP